MGSGGPILWALGDLTMSFVGSGGLKGAGGGEYKVDFHFFVVSYRGECQLPGTRSGIKNYFS